MKKRVRSLSGILGVGVVGITVFGGCSPLPGQSLDPVYLKLPGSKATAQEPTRAAAAAPASEVAPPVATGLRTWVGRFRDSRGEGDITFTLVRSQSMMSGTWRTRTGGGGPVIATVEANGQRWQLRMESSASECPATFEGSLEARGAALVGTYQGKDCEGAVSGGSFEVRPK